MQTQLDAAESGTTVPALALDGAVEVPPATTPTLMTPRVRAAAIQGGAQGVEPLLARINEAEALLMRYSKENERLANLNNRLQFRRQFVDTDYTGVCSPACPAALCASDTLTGLDFAPEAIWLGSGRLQQLLSMPVAGCGNCACACSIMPVSLGSHSPGTA